MGLTFTKDGETDRLTFEDGSGDWVDIKATQSWGDELKVSAAATRKVRQERNITGNSDATIDLDLREQRLTLFETAIVAWSSEQPVNRAAFEAMEAEPGGWLATAIIEHYEAQTITDEDLGKSKAPSEAPSTPAVLSHPSSQS